MTAPFAPLPPCVKRPAALITGCVTVALSALVFGFHSVDQLLSTPDGLDDTFATLEILYGIGHAVMALVSLAAALLLVFGADLGRIVGAGLAGVLTWFSAGWLFRITADLIGGGDSNVVELLGIGGLQMAVTTLGGILGITTMILLSQRSISAYMAAGRASRAVPPPVGLHATPVVAEPPTGSVI